MELVLQSERDAMQRANKPLMFFEVVVELPGSLNGLVESNFEQNIALEENY